MTARGALLGVAVCCWTAAPLHAQLSLRLSGVRSSFAGSPATNALQASPRLELVAGRSSAAIEGTWAHLEDDSWAAHGSAALALGKSLGTGREVALVVEASGNRLENGIRSGQLQAGPMFGARAGPVVLGLGATIGRLLDVADSVHNQWTVRASAGGHAGSVNLVLRGAHADVGALKFSDLELSATRRWGAVLLEAAGGLRHDEQLTRGTWRAQAIWQTSRVVAFDVAGGRYPPSPEGFAEGLYATAGFRVTSVGRAVAPPAVAPAGPGQWRVRFTADGRDVAIAGDWNDWTPVPMNRGSDGRWEALLTLPAGAHKFMLIVDGRNVVPRGVPKLPDGFGGEVGLLVL